MTARPRAASATPTRVGMLVLLLMTAAGLVLMAPPPVAACSCVPLEPLATYADDPETAIFTGTVGALAGDRHPFAVETWYSGPGAAATVAVRSAETREPGSHVVTVDTCGMNFRAGERWLLVAFGAPGPVFEPNICLPSARLETDEGRTLLAEAQREFGPGRDMALPPPTVEPTVFPAESPSPDDADVPVASLGLVGLLVAAVALGVGLALWNARRRARG